MAVSSCVNELNKYLKKGEHCPIWTAGLQRILCMQGGDDDGSYAKNSEAPASALTLSKPLLVEAIQSMKLLKLELDEQVESLRIADLGCATGYNTLATVELVVETLRHRYKQEAGLDPEFEAFFSDLPSNDFNSLFRSLPPKRRYYAAGVPGSFYHRLFPKGKLHVAVSLSALHWLSQIPESVLDKRSRAWNEGRAWIDGAKREVVEAYAKQSKDDLMAFLRCRREEIVKGGMLFMLMAGRPGSNRPEEQIGDPDSRAKHPFTSSMDQAWEDLLNEGLIEKETRDTFNIPAYMRSTEEVEEAFEECGGFEMTGWSTEELWNIQWRSNKSGSWIRFHTEGPKPTWSVQLSGPLLRLTLVPHSLTSFSTASKTEPPKISLCSTRLAFMVLLLFLQLGNNPTFLI
ncbi:hypothetical protein Syun_002771 [Stephania yunnanensis]|uniref:Gibberellic acid methyltransferase 2 n=1 Tax=Stephania yunnanensis TaxID=152371 RepID=A0AAP0LGD8_9MAGN